MGVIVKRPTKRQIARSFGRKARTYASRAVFQQQLLNLLAQRVHAAASRRGLWVDLGSGCGTLQKLAAPYPHFPRFVCVDIAREPLQIIRDAGRAAARCTAVQADIELLPFRVHRFEGAVLASVMQWVHHPAAALEGIQSLLKPKGFCVFAVFTEGSHNELTQVRAAMGLTIPVVRFAPGAFKKALRRAGLDLTECADIADTHYFPTAIDALRHVSASGATAVAGRRLARGELSRFCRAYEDRFGCAQGVPVSYRALVGTAINAGP